MAAAANVIASKRKEKDIEAPINNIRSQETPGIDEAVISLSMGRPPTASRENPPDPLANAMPSRNKLPNVRFKFGESDSGTRFRQQRIEF